MASSVVKSRQDCLLRTQDGDVNAGASSSGGTSGNSGVESPGPVITESGSGESIRSPVATNEQDETQIDWRQQPLETLFAHLDGMEVDEALEFLASMGVKAAEDLLREMQDLRAKAAVGTSLQRAIKAAEKHKNTSEGNRTWQTLLTAAAFPLPANDHQEGGGKEYEETKPASVKRKAAAVGVTEQEWSDAVKRAKLLRGDLEPLEAIRKGFYWFSPLAEGGSDAAKDESALPQNK